uniref:Uncharacterized protein n=1 Tax=Romanomermis culicivorax TaxID=13658 RepID=A0A915IXL2_ROMCU
MQMKNELANRTKASQFENDKKPRKIRQTSNDIWGEKTRLIRLTDEQTPDKYQNNCSLLSAPSADVGKDQL